MKKSIFLFSLLLSFWVEGAVLYEVRDDSIEALTIDNRIFMDLDGDGLTEFLIQAVYRSGIESYFEIDVIAFETTEFLYETGEFGMRFEGVDDGTMIGPGSEVGGLVFSSLWQDSAPSDLAQSIPQAGLVPRPGNFVGETTSLGFRFQGEGGFHYGYALFTDTTVDQTTLVATAWESEPGKGILAGAVPEPSSLAMFLFGLPLFMRRRRC